MPDGTVPDAIQPLVVCGANAESNGCGYGTASLDPTTGAYQITGLLPGSYHVSARYDGSSPDVIQSVDSSNVDVADGQDVRLDLQFEAGAVITGHLTGSDGPLSSAIVTGSWDSGASSGATQATFDPATQTYRFDRLYPQTYTIRFSSTRYGDVTAPPVTVTFGQVVSGVDEVLPRENQISGQLSYDDGSGPVARQGKVSLISSGAEIASTTSDATGHYEFNGVAPGDYRICANGIGYFAQACWGDGGELDAPNVSIASGGSAVGKDITQVAGGILKAQVNMPPEPGGFSVGYEAEVDVWRLDQSAGYYTLFQKFTANEGGTGTVEDEGLPAGTYRVQFIDPLGTYNAQWWSGARYFSDGEDITLSPNQVTDLGKVALMPRTLDVYRTSGSDRYTGSVEMSKETYPSVPNDGVPIVYVANGLNYPDALSAGPAAIAQEGCSFWYRRRRSPQQWRGTPASPASEDRRGGWPGVGERCGALAVDGIRAEAVGRLPTQWGRSFRSIEIDHSQRLPRGRRARGVHRHRQQLPGRVERWSRRRIYRRPGDPRERSAPRPGLRDPASSARSRDHGCRYRRGSG
nr:cell wall-binding repeat-containing protein [Pseudolysinimonas kribbensis]